MTRTPWHLHLLAVVIFAFSIGLLHLREPGFGDELTYWHFAFDLHERGVEAFQKTFHNLRWPVWGVCWALQGIFGPGMISYWGVSLLYLAAGAMLTFGFGRMLLGSAAAAWAGAIAYVFHPLLDTLVFRPMPDISEGVWGGAAMLCWWLAMTATGRLRPPLWAALCGACVFVVEANRLTGIFIVPVLILSTLIYFRARFGWLLFAGLVAGLLYAAECLIYQRVAGDWLLDLHANLRGKGVKGTEPLPMWELPFRFLDTLWEETTRSPVYCILGILGAAFAWLGWARPAITTESPVPDGRQTGAAVLGRVIVLWMVVLYVEYACAPQSISPWRPVVRDGGRFIGSLAVPMSILAAAGFIALCRLVLLSRWRIVRGLARWPIAIGGAAAIVLLFASSSDRKFFDLGFLTPMRAYMKNLPPGAKIYTHGKMRALAYLTDARQAKEITWLVQNVILQKTPAGDALISQADEFWYAHNLVWRSTRVEMERNPGRPPHTLASIFVAPEKEWALVESIADGEVSEMVFYRRRGNAAPPDILDATAPEFAGLFPALPAEQLRDPKKRSLKAQWTVPESMKGRLCRLEIVAASDNIEPMTIALEFMAKGKTLAEYKLRPYLYQQPALDFFAFRIPAEAETCDVLVKFSGKADFVRLTGVRVVVEPR